MSLKLTTAGLGLLLRTLAGETTINFTAIQLGNGSDAGNTALSLSNPLLTLGISEYEVGDIFLTLTAVYNNSEIETSFLATETGVLVDDPDNPGNHILYAYEYTSEGSADRIRAGTDKIVETQLDVMVYIGDAENVTASISQSLVYVTQAQFDEYTKRRDNPHNVTAEQVGLGNVQNEIPEKLLPQFSNAYNEVKYTDYEDEAAGITRKKVSFSNISNGDRLGTILTKIRTAIHVMVEHLNGSNPHYITPKLIGAAKSTHDHSTNDIKSGVLGVPRGGTGGATTAEARSNLGIQAGVSWVSCTAGVEVVCGPIFFEAQFGYAPKVVVTQNTNSADSIDVRMSVQGVTKEKFYVNVLSETTDQRVTFNWIAIQ